MPWTLRMLMMFTLAGGLFQWYVVRKTINAVASVTGFKRRAIRLTAFAILFWLILHPLLMFGSYFLGLAGFSQTLQRSNLAVDAIVTYPFWAGIVLAIQVALFFLVMDVIRLLLFPIYKKHKLRWQKTESYLAL